MFGYLQTSTDANTTTSTLSYHPSKDDAGKTLTCKASNNAMEGAVLEESRQLHIQCECFCPVHARVYFCGIPGFPAWLRPLGPLRCQEMAPSTERTL